MPLTKTLFSKKSAKGTASHSFLYVSRLNELGSDKGLENISMFVFKEERIIRTIGYSDSNANTYAATYEIALLPTFVFTRIPPFTFHLPHA